MNQDLAYEWSIGAVRHAGNKALTTGENESRSSPSYAIANGIHVFCETVQLTPFFACPASPDDICGHDVEEGRFREDEDVCRQP